MVLTRSASSSPIKKPTHPAENAGHITTAKPTTLTSGPVLKFVIAPKDISKDARFLLLKHPRQSLPKRFLFCPEKGLYEFTKIAAPAYDHRSILVTPTRTTEGSTGQDAISQGYVNKCAEYLTATPFDIVFLLVGVISSNKNKLFQPLDDLLEDLEAEEKHFQHILQHGRKFVEDAMSRICDSVDAGDEKMYRYNEQKLLKMILDRAESAALKGLPVSLEQRFVSRALELPVLSIKREDTMTSSVTDKEKNRDTPDVPDESFDSQSTADSSAPSTVFSEASAASTNVTTVEDAVPLEVQRLQKIRIVFDFIVSSYITAEIASRLVASLEGNESVSIDFGPLHRHLQRVLELRAEAAASRSLGDFSRKRGNLEDEEEAEARAEKKRRLEEEEKKRKANLSRGVRELGKVNVTGMKKMSDFFGKKPAAKAKT